MDEKKYVIHCYFTNHVASRAELLDRLTLLLEERVPGAYRLEVMDVLENAAKAVADDVFATPTIIRVRPEPKQLLFGDIGDPRRVLAALGVTGNEPTA